MKKADYIRDIGMASAIISDSIMKKLYAAVQKQGQGYVFTVELISEWAKEFVDKHKTTDWEDALEKGIAPLSKYLKSIICWDDAVMDFAHYKLNWFKGLVLIEEVN